MKLRYLFFRGTTYPVGFLPLSWIHFLGKRLGSLIYHCIPKYRKRCLSNLALATSLQLSNKDIKKIAKLSLQNTAICLLEYAKLIRIKNIDEVAKALNNETLDTLMQAGKGCVIFCGHQANWEVLFLVGTSLYPGVAIGRPIKNKLIYDFVLAVRERFGGKIFPPKRTVQEGMRAIKRGAFLGIVSDQAMTRNGYFSTFLGRKAWTSPICAVLAYRMQVPLLVAMTRREKKGYIVEYSNPIYPDVSQPMSEEVPKIMEKTLRIFEQSVAERPGEWFWQHNRWKQITHERLPKKLRHDCLAIVVPENAHEFLKEVRLLRKKYPNEFVSLFLPEHAEGFSFPDIEIIPYRTLSDILIEDYRFKLVFDLSSHPKIKKHFLSLAAMQVISLEEMRKLF